MTITISFWAIPLVLNIILIIWLWISAANDHTPWIAGFFQFIVGIIGTLLIWLVYCITLLIIK